MDKDKFIETIQNIGTCENDVERRTMLTNLQDEMTKVYDEMETDKTTINTLTQNITNKDNEITALQKANMDYFTRLSSQKSDNQIIKDSTGLDNSVENKRKFENLFDEKGRMKL